MPVVMKTMAFEVIWDVDGLQNFINLGKSTIEKAFEYIAKELWANIRKTPPTPTDEGVLAGSWGLEKLVQMDELQWRIFSNIHHAFWVHAGTGIYGRYGSPIVPTKSKALAFFWKKQGVDVVVRSVAGQQPTEYADRAIEMTEGRVEEFIRMAIAETFGGS
jgi:hypothetical protein